MPTLSCSLWVNLHKEGFLSLVTTITKGRHKDAKGRNNNGLISAFKVLHIPTCQQISFKIRTNTPPWTFKSYLVLFWDKMSCQQPAQLREFRSQHPLLCPHFGAEAQFPKQFTQKQISGDYHIEKTFVGIKNKEPRVSIYIQSENYSGRCQSSG